MSKTQKELEMENKILRELLSQQMSGKSRTPSAPAAPKKRQVMYQCRYCGYKSVRNATEGAPLPE